MTISNFSVTPNVIVPGESVHVSFTLSVTSSDTVNGLHIYGGNAGSYMLYYSDDFTLAAGKSTVISFDKVIPRNLSYVSQNIGTNRSLTDPKWSVVLGSYGSHAEIANPITYLNMRYLPTISSFALERATGGVANDEGVNVLTTLRLTAATGANTAGMSLKLYYAQGTLPTTASAAINLTGQISALLSGVTNSASLITGTFSNGSDWHFLLVFGDSWEQTQARFSLPRAFANLHLSGCATGGACFGGFSASGENAPMLESYYPARFYAGIDGVNNYQEGEVKTGGTWIDGKPIYRRVVRISVTTTGSTVTAATLGSNLVDSIVSIRGIMDRDSYFCPSTFYLSSANYCSVFFTKDGGLIRVQTSHKMSGWVILEYTKTTD